MTDVAFYPPLRPRRADLACCVASRATPAFVVGFFRSSCCWRSARSLAPADLPDRSVGDEGALFASVRLSSAFWFRHRSIWPGYFHSRALWRADFACWPAFAVCVISGIVQRRHRGHRGAVFGKLDGAIMRLMDALMSFPAILLALGELRAALGPARFSQASSSHSTVAYIPAGGSASFAPRP